MEKWHERNRERLRLDAKKRYAANREMYKAQRKAYRKANVTKVRDSKLRSAFGISIEEYEQRARDQNGVCAICRCAETETRHGVVRRLCVDHDHATKKVRGLLCSHCNLALGYLHDDPLRAHSAENYLERHRG